MSLNYNKQLACLATLVTLIIFSSCNSGIDRDKAAKLVNDAYAFPKTIELDLITGTVNMPKMDFNGDKGEQILVQNGYRKDDIVNEYNDQMGSILEWEKVSVNYQLTDKANPFIIRENSLSTNKDRTLKIGTFELGSIISLRKISESEYEVEFNVIPNLNELGQLVYGVSYGFMSSSRISGSNNPQYQHNLMPKQGVTVTQKILKYDDGWRIANEDINTFKNQIDVRMN